MSVRSQFVRFIVWCMPLLLFFNAWFTLSLKSVNAKETDDSYALIIEALSMSEDTAVQAAILKGMLGALEGRRNVKAPAGWSELSSKFASSKNAKVRESVLILSQIFGDQSAIQRAIETVKDNTNDTKRRRTTLNLLLNQQNREASNLLESLIEEPNMRLTAIRGYAIVKNSKGPSVLLKKYSNFDSQNQRAVIETLASRKIYAQELLTALKNRQISRDAIPAQVARTLSEMLGKQFTDVFGEIKTVNQDRTQLIAKYKRICSPKAIKNANASRGRVVFKKTCAACHMLYGEGGKVGPDLTGSNRGNLDYILLNSIAPSYDVPDAYKTVTVITVDGRVVNGVLAEEDTSRIILKTPQQPRVVIAKSDIFKRSVSDKSMMPEGQLDALKQQEVIDLIKYLRTTEQVELP